MPKYNVCARVLNVSQKHRIGSGAVLAEGVVALWMVTVGVVAGVTLLINAGMYTFYKEKVGYIGDQAAQVAATMPVGDYSRKRTLQLVKEMLGQMNLPSNDLEVTVTATRIVERPAVNVEIKINNLPLFGNGDICPIKIGIDEKATAISKGGAAADGYMVMRGQMTGYLIPMVRMPNNGQAGLDAPLMSQ